MVVWIWSWMEGLGLEVDENFGTRFLYSKVRDFAGTSPLAQNTLVAVARSIFYRQWH
jgi:hypothetical protein